jgi:hypothetical protein
MASKPLTLIWFDKKAPSPLAVWAEKMGAITGWQDQPKDQGQFVL